MSTLVGRAKDKKKPDQVVVFEEVAEARTELARLFEWAWSATFAPLPFFPKASREFAEQAIKDKYDQAWRNAHQKYHGGESNFSLPESEEELEHARLWEGMSPLDVERDLPLQYRFDEVAEAFFAPLFRARRGATE